METRTLLVDDDNAEGTMVFAVTLTMPREDVERQLVAAYREHLRTGQLFLLAFAGLQHETRPWSEIPEVRAKAQELLDIGVGGILEFTTNVPSRASDFVRQHGLLGSRYGFGFFELACIALGTLNCDTVPNWVLDLCDEGIAIQRGRCELLRQRLSGVLN